MLLELEAVKSIKEGKPLFMVVAIFYSFET
jgi:hypothetical protein